LPACHPDRAAARRKLGRTTLYEAKNLAAFGRNVREARLKQEMLQKELGERADIEVTYIGRIEAGDANLEFRTMERIAETLGVTITDLIGEKNGDT